jgi:small conductance mechanosensitive channel
LLTVTVLAVLSQFGIQTTSLVAVIGAASLAIGLALQGTLSNLAAGVMLLIFRPFRIGNSVTIGGNSGTVKALSLF